MTTIMRLVAHQAPAVLVLLQTADLKLAETENSAAGEDLARQSVEREVYLLCGCGLQQRVPYREISL